MALLPSMETNLNSTESTSNKMMTSYTYGLKGNRIAGYVDGIEAVKQAIYHILMTERYAYTIYDKNYGIELEQYIGSDLNFVEATIEETLRDALTHDLRITDVTVNSIEQLRNDVVGIGFTASTIYGNINMEVGINV